MMILKIYLILQHVPKNRVKTDFVARRKPCKNFDQYKNNSFSKKVHEELDSQLDEQFFLDGGHFEGSPMYHSIIVEDLLDIHNLYSSIEGDCSNIDDINSKLRDIIPLSIGWLEKMTHPNKEISFFND